MLDIISPLRENCGECPLWGVLVSVPGIYVKIDDSHWKFRRAECPIIQNAKLPIYKQKQEYKLMFCKDKFSCPLYTQFQPSITLDK